MKLLLSLKNDFLSIATLFTSVSTLICCALPIFLVTIGMGAVMAGLVSNVPFLITISEYKVWTFLAAGTLIATNFWFIYGRKNKVEACEIDDNGRETACNTASRWSKSILWISGFLYIIGFGSAYLSVPIIKFFE